MFFCILKLAVESIKPQNQIKHSLISKEIPIPIPQRQSEKTAGGKERRNDKEGGESN